MYSYIHQGNGGLWEYANREGGIKTIMTNGEVIYKVKIQLKNFKKPSTLSVERETVWK